MLLGKTTCECGKEIKSFTNYEAMKLDDKFYGGRVSMSATCECECGKKYKGFFATEGIGVKLIDLEPIEEQTEAGELDEKTEEPKKVSTKTKSSKK